MAKPGYYGYRLSKERWALLKPILDHLRLQVGDRGSIAAALDYALRVANENLLEKGEKKMWVELYRGSGRPTGRTADEPVYMNTGEVAPGWAYMTKEEFEESFEWGQHDQCHSPERADPYCSYCQEAGWVD